MKIYKIAALETITQAAIRDPKTGEVYTGWRHCFIGLEMIQKGYCKKPYPGGSAQGFVTNTGRFVSREEALKIATDAKQKIIKKHGNPNLLYSEDVWDINGNTK